MKKIKIYLYKIVSDVILKNYEKKGKLNYLYIYIWKLLETK